MLPVAAGLVEVDLGDMGAVDVLVSSPLLGTHDEVFQLTADRRAFRQPDDQSTAHLLGGHEQPLVPADAPVVALLRLLQAPEVIFELLRGRPRRGVQALELRTLLVALPVRRGDTEQLERTHAARSRNVRTAAEVGELANLIRGDRRALGQIMDRLDLVRLVCEQLQRLLAGQFLAHERLVRHDESGHPLLDLLEVIGRQRARQLEVVVVAVLDGRPVCEAGIGEHLQHRRGHDMRGGVAHPVKRRHLHHLPTVVHLVLRAGLNLRAHCVPPKKQKAPRPIYGTKGRSFVVPPEFAAACTYCLVACR